MSWWWYWILVPAATIVNAAQAGYWLRARRAGWALFYAFGCSMGVIAFTIHLLLTLKIIR